MGYLQALQLMVRAYKAAKGVMPKGLDLLKLKMKARQKAIDSQKVVQAADKFDKGNWFKLNRKPAKEGFGKPKKIETEAEMLARMKRQNKEAAQRLRDKKKLRDDKATGGLANLSQTYDNNPTLQSQFPNKQDYLDLFSSTTTTTPQTQTYAQMTQQPAAGIPAVKPIVPIIPPQGDGGDGGGGITTRTGYGYRGPSMTIDDIEEGTITPAEERFAQGQALRGFAEKTLLGNLFFKAKDAVSDKAREIADKVRAEEIAKAEALRSLQEAIARNQARASQQDWSGASSDYSGGFDPSTGNYDDPYDPGETE